MDIEEIEVPFVVEGDTDVPFAKRLIQAAGAPPGTPYVMNGKPSLLERVPKFIAAGKYQPWLILVDRDGDHGCAPSAARVWSQAREGFSVLRVVETAIEAWALGDRQRLARFFRLREGRLPKSPERVSNPKRRLVDLCRSSTRRSIQRDMIPRQGSGRSQGPGYEARLIEFGELHWRVDNARSVCPSLEAAIRRLRATLETFVELRS